MKKILLTLFCIFLNTAAFAQASNNEQQRDLAFNHATQGWFSAWSLVSKEIFKLPNVKPVDFVFFDDEFVYSTSSVNVSNGVVVEGPSLLNMHLEWKRAPHNGKLILPNNDELPLQLMSFATQNKNDNNKPFFVMPLPSYWSKAGVTSSELGLDNLVTGVFLHEFSHSQQVEGFGKSIAQFEAENELKIEISDDITQDVFKKNTAYESDLRKEIDTLYQSTQGQQLNKKMVQDALAQMSRRQERYFTGQFSALKKMDTLFLTMEGLGQYSIYLWLTHPNGANIAADTAIEGIRRKRNFWSQDEGLALFLVVHKLKASGVWVKSMFSDTPEEIVAITESLLR